MAAGAWVSHLALVEATWVLSSVYDRTSSQIATAVDLLLDHDTLTLQDPDVVRAAPAMFRDRPRLGFSDCLMVPVARKAGHTPLGTFDTALGGVEGAQRF